MYVFSMVYWYRNDEIKRNSCRLWRDWFPPSFYEHLSLLFPDIRNATDKTFVQYISKIKLAYNLYDGTLIIQCHLARYL